jgi:hypothetical protein
VPDFADHTIITDPVTPQGAEWAGQSLAEGARGSSCLATRSSIEIQKSAGPRACPTWSAVSWRFGCKQSPKQRSVLTCEPGWIFSSPLRTPLENVGGEIVVLEIVQAVLDHLAQVEGLAAPGLSGQVFQSLLKLSRRVGMEVGIKR